MILITRPLDEATTTENQLHQKGYKTMLEPMLTIHPLVEEIIKAPIQAAVFTSLNGIRYVGHSAILQAKMALTVGDHTADMARGRGFNTVYSASGNADQLYGLCLNKLKPEAGPVIHFCGDVTRGHLVERLQRAGYDASEQIVYHAVANVDLRDETIRSIKQGRITSTLFFSPRTAKVFMQNMAQQGLQSYLRGMRAYCLSHAVSNELGEGVWKEVLIADHPQQDSLLDLIDAKGA